MLKKCKITIHDISIIVNMKKTLTSVAIWETLPYTSINKKWGDENYFRFDINCPLECDAKSVIELGDIVFWPEGKCIAIGYGPTPISKGQEIRLISKCNIWGESTCNIHRLKKFSGQEKVKIERL